MNTNQDQWTAVDRYITDWLVAPDEALEAALRSSAAAGLPAIQVTPNQGRFLELLARLQGARTILEIGTLGGYSTIWLARALPADGSLVTLELNPAYAEVARVNIGRSPQGHLAELRVGPALDSLAGLAAEGRGPFDVIFIDADKANTATYFEWALKLVRRGSLIIIDNVIRKGAVIEPDNEDPAIQGIRRFYEKLAGEPRVKATALQTVGSKGYDGFAIALVTDSLNHDSVSP